ncbi:MAG TPA: serine/threonine-protein kinase [Longimicrobiales bacterium]|nr:serine/threonine-protein kinase [Longimicrobiales bacterium]
MDDTREHRLEALFEAAAALPPEQRARFVQHACRDDPALAADALRLLQHADSADDRLTPALERAVESCASALMGDPAVGVVDPLIGRRVGRYDVLERLGAGGMGRVYSARDPTLGRIVALKFLPLHLGADPTARSRLMAEAKAASGLDHPNICTVHEIAPADLPGDPRDGSLFITMVRYEGETIAAKLAHGPLRVEEALDYATQVADGLEAASEAGLVHSDLKPANLIVTPAGRIKILDFGVATYASADCTAESTIRGTLAYMSPEQTRGEPIDGRADVWALGAVLYEMLTGVRPFPGRDAEVLLHQIRSEIPAPVTALRPEVPEPLAGIVDRCLQKDPNGRYRSAAALRQDLQAVLAEGGALATREGGRRMARLPALLAFAVLLVGAGVLSRLLPVGGAAVRQGSGAGSLDSTAIAVLPFAAAARDSALEQLGRDLAITLAAALDGIEDLRAVSSLAVLARAGPDARLDSPDARLALAQQLGAGRMLRGTLTRSANAVLVHASLYDVGQPRPRARAVVSGDPEQLMALTDSVALALVRQLWSERTTGTPVLGAVGTRSVAALRAYLEGEQAYLRGDMPRAVNAFERAFAADSSFWFAYWRSLRPRGWYAGNPADSSRIRRMFEHLHTFPPQDRLLVESWRAETLTERLRLLREATGRFDSYWPAWDAYSDQLLHNAPYLGTTLADTRAATERLVALNREFAIGWDRLGWVATAQQDTVALARASRELQRTMTGVDFRSVVHRINEIGDDWLRNGLPEADSLAGIVEWMLSEPERLIIFFAHALVGAGRPRDQLEFNRFVLGRERRPRVTSELWKTISLSWFSRGAWDSALVAMDRAAAAWPHPRTARDAYGLAVAGAVFAITPARAATPRRPREDGGQVSAAELAELAWLDGILAYVRNDAAALARARSELERSSAPYVNSLRGSLAAFALDAVGQRARAGRELAQVEWAAADSYSPPPTSLLYPYLVPVNRLVASRWLRQTGQEAEAARLLTWFDATSTAQLQAQRQTFGGLGLVDRAEIAESTGDRGSALTFYSRFLERHDLPVPALRPLTERAHAGLARLGREAELPMR